MQLTLMSASGTTAMSDQLVVVGVEAEGVITPTQSHVTLRSP